MSEESATAASTRNTFRADLLEEGTLGEMRGLKIAGRRDQRL